MWTLCLLCINDEMENDGRLLRKANDRDIIAILAPKLG